jgi:hypothetical protein
LGKLERRYESITTNNNGKTISEPTHVERYLIIIFTEIAE